MDSGKKIPEPKNSIRGYPFLPLNLKACLGPGKAYHVKNPHSPQAIPNYAGGIIGNPNSDQAGLLANGSSYLLRLPGFPRIRQWQFAAFVSDYSDGLASDSHGIPYQAQCEHLVQEWIILKLAWPGACVNRK